MTIWWWKKHDGHIFYFGKSPITWFSQKQDTVYLSFCEAEFMARQAIWLKDLLYEVIGVPFAKNVIQIDNRSAIALRTWCLPTYQISFYKGVYWESSFGGRACTWQWTKSRHLTKAPAWIKYNEMRKLIGFHNIDKRDFKTI